jgi:hypothetical protein
MCEIDWSAVAAWVQAVGSVLAIFAAVWIGERSSRLSRDLVERERQRQADIVASTVAMKLGLVLVELQKKSQYALDLCTQVKDEKITKIDTHALSKILLLTTHESLTQLRSSVMLFDRDSGILTITALDMLDEYNRSIESAIAMYEFKGSKPDDLAKLCELVHKRMGNVAELCSKAEARLERVHDLDHDEAG